LGTNAKDFFQYILTVNGKGEREMGKTVLIQI
jgi:hypothetical protein